MATILNGIELDPNAPMPLHMQLAEKLLQGWVSGNLKAGQMLPSLHDFSVALEVSKQTVEKAYRALREMGVVSAYHGKGYFICEGQGELLLEKLKTMKNRKFLTNDKKWERQR